MNKKTNTVGKQILDIITSGMYSNAMMVLREYVQNAADAIDCAISNKLISQESSRIDINIDGESRTITISDNGAGVSSENVGHILNSIGISSKTNGNCRGFRGIGRLGGLGYCDKVVFETRSLKSEPITVAEWDSNILRNECRNINDETDLIDVLNKIVKGSKREAILNDHPHFFKVKMINIHRFHKDELMNLKDIYNYLSQVSPVPYDNNVFSFSNEITNNLCMIDGFRSYNIYLNGNKIFKPHRNSFAISGQTQDLITGLHFFDIKGRNSNCIGRGWFAKSSFKASLLQSDKMRGIRLRQGNIEVGDEYLLSDFYSERRFSTWHIGEIHFNYNLRLNARRDGFEQSDEYECFLEQCTLLCRHLSTLCRNASKIRSKQFILQKTLENVEKSIETATFTGNKTRRNAIQTAQSLLKSTNNQKNKDELRTSKIANLWNKINRLENDSLSLSGLLDGRILRNIDQKILIEDITTHIIDNYDVYKSPVELVKAIVTPYLRKDIDLKRL